MGFLDNSTITVDAILTKRGREILSTGGDFQITKFLLFTFLLFDFEITEFSIDYISIVWLWN